MMPATLDVLRHVGVHGSRTRAEALKAFPAMGHTIENLAHLGYITPDGISKPNNYILTKKGLERLANPLGRQSTTKRRPDLMVSQLRGLPVMRQADARNPRHYQPAEYEPSTRPGAMKAFELPSRMGNRLHWRDGRVTDMAGNPITTP